MCPCLALRARLEFVHARGEVVLGAAELVRTVRRDGRETAGEVVATVLTRSRQHRPTEDDVRSKFDQTLQSNIKELTPVPIPADRLRDSVVQEDSEANVPLLVGLEQYLDRHVLRRARRDGNAQPRAVEALTRELTTQVSRVTGVSRETQDMGAVGEHEDLTPVAALIDRRDEQLEFLTCALERPVRLDLPPVARDELAPGSLRPDPHGPGAGIRAHRALPRAHEERLRLGIRELIFVTRPELLDHLTRFVADREEFLPGPRPEFDRVGQGEVLHEEALNRPVLRSQKGRLHGLSFGLDHQKILDDLLVDGLTFFKPFTENIFVRPMVRSLLANAKRAKTRVCVYLSKHR